jgi:RecA-family ATPase
MNASESPGLPSFRNVWVDDLDAAPPSCPWLWHGYLASGCITLLTSPWKAGKTTLVSALLTRLGSGGELAGLPVRAGRAAIVSEESIEQWRLRKQKFGFGRHVCWLCRPFRGQPSLPAWLALLDHLLDLRQEHGLDLVVIDPLAGFLPARSESEPTSVLRALTPLGRLTAAGLAVWLLHHPRKQGGPGGLWARGSGVLPAQADIVMRWPMPAAPATPTAAASSPPGRASTPRRAAGSSS